MNPLSRPCIEKCVSILFSTILVPTIVYIPSTETKEVLLAHGKARICIWLVQKPYVKWASFLKLASYAHFIWPNCEQFQAFFIHSVGSSQAKIQMSFTQQHQLIVKAYYNDLVEQQPEIRRFAVSFPLVQLFWQEWLINGVHHLFLDRCVCECRCVSNIGEHHCSIE